MDLRGEVLDVGLDNDLAIFPGAVGVLEFDVGDSRKGSDEDHDRGVALHRADGQQPFLGVGDGFDGLSRGHLKAGRAVEQHHHRIDVQAAALHARIDDVADDHAHRLQGDEQDDGAAVAVELVQVGSLVHDDIFDGAETRRGTPTINAVEGQDQALLAGTYLMARAAAEAAAAGQQVASDLARTVALLCVGQATETQHLFDVSQEIDRYLFTIEAKTAALFACSCRVGALSAELPGDHVNRFGEFGRDFGMAFQLIDDVLDVIGDADRLGKPVGTDLRCGVLTLPALLELAQPSGGDLRALLLRRQDVDLEQASKMMVNSSRIGDTIELARQYADAAAAAISEVPGASYLSRFAPVYVDWALEEFVTA